MPVQILDLGVETVVPLHNRLQIRRQNDIGICPNQFPNPVKKLIECQEYGNIPELRWFRRVASQKKIRSIF